MRKGFRQVKEKAQADQDFEASAEVRNEWASRFPGVPFFEGTRRLVELDTALSRDPVTEAARIAATYGMPVLPHQHAQAERARSEQENTTQINQWIDRGISDGVLPPTLRDPQVSAIMTGLARAGYLDRPSGDPMVDVLNLHDQAMKLYHEQRGAEQERVQRAKRASVSLTGAPSSGGGGSSRSSGGPIQDQIRDSFAELRGRA